MLLPAISSQSSGGIVPTTEIGVGELSGDGRDGASTGLGNGTLELGIGTSPQAAATIAVATMASPFVVRICRSSLRIVETHAQRLGFRLCTTSVRSVAEAFELGHHKRGPASMDCGLLDPARIVIGPWDALRSGGIVHGV